MPGRRVAALIRLVGFLSGVFMFSFPSAFAAKVRKKPPLTPLPEPMVAMDNDMAVGAARRTEGSAIANEAKPLPQASSQTLLHQTKVSERSPQARIPYPISGLICLYGETRVPSTGRVRCLAPEELVPPRRVRANTQPFAEQLGILENSPGIIMPLLSASGELLDSEGGDENEDKIARVVRVSFENGAVSGALRNLRAVTDELAGCVEDNGGLRARSARVKLLFFVKSSQKPSDMIVASAKNVPAPVVRCVRKVIAETTIGRPSTNAVGVTALIELRDEAK